MQTNCRLILAGVFALGCSAVVTQLVMMREMLCAFSGNELVLGIVLGNWLLLTGLGAFLGRWSSRLEKPTRAFALGLILAAALPWHQLFLFRMFRELFFVRGSEAGVTGTILASLGFLAPFCVLSGFLLVLAGHILGERENDAGIGRVYMADSIGSVAGGALFSFVLINYCGHFRALQGLAVFTFLLGGFATFYSGKRLFLLGSLIAVESFWIMFAHGDWDLALTKRDYNGQRVLLQANSPYGRLVVVDFEKQTTFFENGLPVIATRNVQQAEETAHYALAQRPKARRVLLIGGGVSGVAREILKYGVEEVTYVELDPRIIEAGRRFLPENLADPRIKVKEIDGRLFIKQSLSNRYDAVIVDMPDPFTSQINRFYTTEFFKEVKRVLVRDGVLLFGLSRYENYAGTELERLLGTARATARESFRNLLLIPGGRVYFLASDGELFSDIANRIEMAGVSTLWMKRGYLDATLAPDRMADLQRAAECPARLNTDFQPVLYFYQLRYWLSQFGTRFGLLEGTLLLSLVVYLLMLPKMSWAVFASGFAASAVEVVLLLGFQILCGSLYRQLGVIVTIFMAGLAVGAWVGNRRRHPRLSVLAFGIAGLAVLLPFLLRQLGDMGSGAAALVVAQSGIALLAFALAVLAGMEFSVAARIQFESGAATASRLFTADCAGAFLGALLASSFLIPAFGVTTTCMATAVLNAVAGVAAWSGGKP